MVAGSEVGSVIGDFEDAHQLTGIRNEVLHHDRTESVQNAFRKSVVETVKKAQKISKLQF